MDWTTSESLGIVHSVGVGISGKLITLIEEELEGEKRADRLRDLSEALRNVLGVTGSKSLEDERQNKGEVKHG